MNYPNTEHNRYVLLRAIVLNKYGLVLVAFIIWMLFFDSKNVFVQYKLTNRIEELKNDKNVYMQKYENVMKEKHDLNKDIVKFAREKYFMHKENEEVYIVK